ncbi:MAG: transglutaminase-like domain-containing protein [Melioribacteraceae bacterium]|nr:transglutaminase-like domain-containing protein [Melioribacteraceae bacterium]
MNGSKKLQYLLELIDDDTPEVRNEILKELGTYGMSLEEDILEYSGILTEQKLHLIKPLIDLNRRRWLKNEWNSWFDLEDENEKIEKALTYISGFHYGYSDLYEFPNMIDELSEEFLLKRRYGDELDLANFLFQEKGIKGAKENYYNPFHSNPIYAIKEKKGLPITLALIYILVGGRLGYEIKGCNFPGHFLAKFQSDNDIILVDCFNGGKFFYENDLEFSIPESKETISRVIREDASAFTIIRRVLNNLIGAYSFINDNENHKFFNELLKETPH